jgi:hypothetical protein
LTATIYLTELFLKVVLNTIPPIVGQKLNMLRYLDAYIKAISDYMFYKAMPRHVEGLA